MQGVEKLPPGEVFIFPEGNAYVFNRVAQVRRAPFRGELAISFANEQLRKVQAEDFVRTQIVALRRAAEANITYGKGYKPENPDLGIAPVKGQPGQDQSGAPTGPVQGGASNAIGGTPIAPKSAAPK